MLDKTISVIIPTFNEEAYIERCLKSVLDQTHAVNEIIVVDNNSTDNTKEIVSKFDNVVLLDESKQGQLYARTKGFNYAESEILATIDADSHVDPTWVEEMLKFADETGSDAVSGYIYVDEGHVRGLVAALGNFFAFKVNRIISGHAFLFGANMMLSSQVWEEVKNNLRQRTDLWEDLDIAILAHKRGFKMNVHKKQLVSVSIRQSKISLAHNYRRQLGWPKTYWPYNKVAAILSVIALHLAILTYGIMYIPATTGYKTKGKEKYTGW